MAGVTTFFVLSGYLITGTLLTEDRIDLRNFYLRRAIRLGPALIVLVVFAAAIGILAVRPWPWLPGTVASLLYVSNWAHIAGVDLGLLGHTWTLAVEEQFYVIWPVSMFLAPRSTLLPIAFAGAVGGTAMYALNVGPDAYHSTLTNGGALLAGSAAALARRTIAPAMGRVGVALIVIAAMFWSQSSAVLGAVLVVTTRIDALLPLGPLGRRAYSLYLWSWPLTMILGGVLALPLAVGAAEVSYRCVERPLVNRFRPRFAGRRITPTVSTPSSAARSVMTQAQGIATHGRQ
jgi:peptidoglycan/LPS O-acetylase OafA/YrhL